MSKKKKSKKNKRLKQFVITLDYSAIHYRFIEATSLKEAQKMWKDGTWEDTEYDFDESCQDESLVDIQEVP